MLAALVLVLVASLAGCGGSGGGVGNGSGQPSPTPVPTATVRFQNTLEPGTLARIAHVTTAGGSASVVPSGGGTVTVPIDNATPLVLATDSQGGLVLASLGTESELSETSTATALLWMWLKPVSGDQVDNGSFASMAARAPGFDRLVAAIKTALQTGANPVRTATVLGALNDVALAIGTSGPLQVTRATPLREIASPRLLGFLDLLQTDNPVTGNLFVNATGNASVFNGTALYWSAYSESYQGQRTAEPEILKPVSLADARRYEKGDRPSGGYQPVSGHPSVAYDLRVEQDVAARRANAILIVRTALNALLGTVALQFGDPVACVNQFVTAVAPAELEGIAAKADASAVEAYLSAYRLALAKASLESVVLSAPCSGNSTLVQRLTRHMPLLQAGLKVFIDAFGRVGEAGAVAEAAGTWPVLAENFAFAADQSHAVGVCVADGLAKPCPVRYGLAVDQPWLEGARGTLPLVAFDARDEPTLVPSTLRVSSPNLLPLIAGPQTAVQLLNAGETVLRLQDEPTGHDSSDLAVRVEPGQIGFVSFLGSATSGPFRVDETRVLGVVANSNTGQFQGDVEFTWTLAAGSEGIIDLAPGGARIASVKALRVGTAVVRATNTVTGRRLEFVVLVEPPSNTHWSGKYWTEGPTGSPPYDGLIGGTVVLAEQPYGFFSFVSGEPGLIVGNSEIRRQLPVTWRAADPRLGFEIPLQRGSERSVLTFDFVVAERSDTRIAGTMTLTHVTPSEVQGGLPTVHSVVTGGWFADRVEQPKPALQMHGFDMCYRSNVAANFCQDLQPYWCFGSFYGIQNATACSGFALDRCQPVANGCSFGEVYPR